MGAQQKNIFIGIGALLLAILACQGPPTPPPANSNDGLSLTLTSVIQTLTAVPTSIPASATFLPGTLPSATISPPAFEPTITLTLSPTVPMVSVTKGTNCRSGPGVVYNILGGAPVGIKFVLIGKSTPTNYWIIRLQDGRECWLWGQYAIVEGNVAALPEYAIPPTPLPPLGSITGTVRDPGGNALPGATVVAQLSNQTMTSGPDGTYSFDNLPLRTEYITADSSNFAPAYLSVNVVSGNTSGVDIQLNSLSIPSGGQIIVQGRVLMNSSPAPGVTVLVWSRSKPVTTDNNGWYSIPMDPDFGYGGILVLVQLGNMRGAAEWLGTQPETVLMPDIILLSR